MLFIFGLIFGHFLPGAVLSRLILRRVDVPLAFLLSSLVLTLAVTFTVMMQWRATLGGVAAAMAGVVVAGLAGVWVRERRGFSAGPAGRVRLRLRRVWRVALGSPMAGLCALGAAAIFAAFVAKSGCLRLVGYDVPIRWEYLASRGFEQGNFWFYPPVTLPDFALYNYPDAIGLMVPSGYWWAYALAGKADITYCLPWVWMQLAMVLWAGWDLAWALGAGVRRRWLAVFLLAATGVVTTNVLIGQEMGLLVTAALVMLGLVVKVRRGRVEAGEGAIAIGLVCAGAALTREYGLAYALFAALVVGMRAGWKVGAAILGVCVAGVGGWLAYVWALTGNPFYTIGVFGLFPRGAPYYVLWMQDLTELIRRELWQRVISWDAVVCVAQSVPAVLGVWLLAWWNKPRGVLAGFAGMAGVLAVWAYFHSGGDLYFSYRVIAPGAAVLAVVCGVIACRGWNRGYGRWWPAAVLVVLAVHALLSLALRPHYFGVFPGKWSAMLAERGRGDRVFTRQVVISGFIESNLERFKGKTILASDPYVHRALAGMPLRVVPIWAPGLEAVMDPAVEPLEARRALKKAGIDFVVVDQASFADMSWITRSPWFRAEHGLLYPRVKLSEDVEIMAVPAIK